MAVASEKVLWRVPPTILYIRLPNGCCFIKVLWRVPQPVLYIYLPVSSWGQSCVNCSHVSPIQIQSAENDPTCRCCWGILLAYYLKTPDPKAIPGCVRVWQKCQKLRSTEEVFKAVSKGDEEKVPKELGAWVMN